MGTLSEPWEPWEPLLGNLGTFTWEPLLGNLYLGTFTWNLGTLGEWVLELLRSAPKPLLWLKTPKHSAVGEKRKRKEQEQEGERKIYSQTGEKIRQHRPQIAEDMFGRQPNAFLF